MILNATVEQVLRGLPRHPDYYRQCEDRLDEFMPQLEGVLAPAVAPKV